LSKRLAIPVIESVSNAMNFPAENPMHWGHQWNTAGQNELLAGADFVLVLDSDVPWIPMKNKPANDATVYYIDIDPLKEEMPLWYIPSKRFFKADAQVALQQINEYLESTSLVDVKTVAKRWEQNAEIHARQCKENLLLEEPTKDVITPEYLTACVREIIDEDTIVLNEGISNYQTICTHIGAKKPGTLHGSGAGSLGWNGGAAIGMKLANPDKTVVSLTGDGSFLFSIPSVVHWMAKRYDTPFLTVIYNNSGWKSPKLSTLGVHPNGVANETDQFHVNFDPPADLAKIAEVAGNAHAQTVKKPNELKAALRKAMKTVKEGRTAVVDVYIPNARTEDNSIHK